MIKKNITQIIKHLSQDLNLETDFLLQQIKNRLPENTTIDNIEAINLAPQVIAGFINYNPDYSILAGRIQMWVIHQNVDIKKVSFTQNLLKIHKKNPKRINKNVIQFVIKNKKILNTIISYQEDYNLDYPTVQSFVKRGLTIIDGKVAETPCQMFLRVAIGLNIYQKAPDKDKRRMTERLKIKNQEDNFRILQRIKEYYQALSSRKISVPGPIILHAGSELNQMSSCYLQYAEDSLVGDTYFKTGKAGGILKAITQLSAQSKGGGGNAITLTDIRGKGSILQKSNGKSNGILPFMKMFDSTIGAVDQSGKRAGTCAVYLEPWHIDVLEFLEASDHFITEEKRCKNLFYCLYCNDLFFERLVTYKNEAKWTLFDPSKIKDYLDKPLSKYYGEEFKEKYLYLEDLGLGTTIPLMEIWNRVCKLMQISGGPYIVNKDQMNLKSNQQNLGTIKSSNLCTEIALVSNEQETAVCVLSSICVSRLYNTSDRLFDFNQLIQLAELATKNLNNVIDIQYYPTPETRNSCLKRRAIGIGVQGLANLFALMKIDFDSLEAKKINKHIYECIYYGALKASMELSKLEGPYTGFENSPASKGILQYDFWKVSENDLFLADKWKVLKQDIIKYGLRNSEVTALMPTASSSVRMSNNEMHEPFTRNLYVRSTIAGSIQIINKYLVEDLRNLDLWNENMVNQIIINDGSIQNISNIPENIKSRYRTAYEIDYKSLIDMMANRSPFVSQTASLNHFVSYVDSGPTAFTQRIIYGWKKGLKTLSYYMHTETISTAKKELGGINEVKPAKFIESIKNPEKILADGSVCIMAEGCEDCQS